MFQRLFQVALLLCILLLRCTVNAQHSDKTQAKKIRPPNILFIMADDLGWNDIGYNNPYIKTPTLNKLAAEGMVLNQSYVQSVCTPSRAAMLTGKYPFKLGYQHFVLNEDRKQCLPTSVKFLPESLRSLGYKTHLVGKWHLGYCNWRCTPLYKGFDSFYGFYNGGEDHFDHKLGGYLDLWDNHLPVLNHNDTYSSILFADKTIEKIRSHNKKNPLFIFLSMQAPHNPLQVPTKYQDMYPEVSQCKPRQKNIGMITAMDDSIGRVIETLKQESLYENTLIVFTTDNGGIDNPSFGGGSNYPLRGAKGSLWEGATRGPAFVHGKLLNKTGIIHNGMFHITDWYNTLIGVAGGKTVADLDSINQWDMLGNGGKSKRTEFVYNIDNFYPPVFGKAAIRVGDYKLIDGFPGLALSSGWSKPQTTCHSNWLQTALYLMRTYLPQYIVDRCITAKPSTVYRFIEQTYEAAAAENDALKPCQTGNKPFYTNLHNVSKEGCRESYLLFNLKDDPLEKVNIADENVEIVKELSKKLKTYYEEAVPAIFPDLTEDGHPSKFNNLHSPGWC